MGRVYNFCTYMNCKKEDKILSDYNFMLEINVLSNELRYLIRDKNYRIQLDNVFSYYGSFERFPYKNLEITCWREHIFFTLV